MNDICQTSSVKTLWKSFGRQYRFINNKSLLQSIIFRWRNLREQQRRFISFCGDHFLVDLKFFSNSQFYYETRINRIANFSLSSYCQLAISIYLYAWFSNSNNKLDSSFTIFKFYVKLDAQAVNSRNLLVEFCLCYSKTYYYHVREN